jgi:hypothetical protein
MNTFWRLNAAIHIPSKFTNKLITIGYTDLTTAKKYVVALLPDSPPQVLGDEQV